MSFKVGDKVAIIAGRNYGGYNGFSEVVKVTPRKVTLANGESYTANGYYEWGFASSVFYSGSHIQIETPAHRDKYETQVVFGNFYAARNAVAKLTGKDLTQAQLKEVTRLLHEVLIIKPPTPNRVRRREDGLERAL